MSNSKLVYSTDKTLTNLDESVDVVSVRASDQKVRLHLALALDRNGLARLKQHVWRLLGDKLRCSL